MKIAQAILGWGILKAEKKGTFQTQSKHFDSDPSYTCLRKNARLESPSAGGKARVFKMHGSRLWGTARNSIPGSQMMGYTVE